MEVGDKLNPQRSYRKGFALKGLHQHIIKKTTPLLSDLLGSPI